MRNKKLLTISILAISLFINGCKKDDKVAKNNVSNEVKFYARKATFGSVNGHINVDGTVEANDTIDIFVNKKLKVKEVFVQEGDYVEKGQILMTFDETSRNTIKRNLEKEKIVLKALKREYNIEKELNKIGGSSLNSVIELEENIKTSELSIEEYEEELEQTAEKIESPVSGTITDLYAQENYSVNTDEPLLKLTDLSDIKIVLEIPEYNVKDISLNQYLTIKPEVFEKKQSFSGKIVKISSISKVSETTGENVLEVDVKSDEIIPYIVPGFNVSARIYIGNKKPGIVVPATAILNENEKYYLFLSDENGNITKAYVTIKPLKGDSVIVTSGMKEGDIYILNPSATLVEKQKINITLSEKTSDSKKTKKMNGRRP